MSMDTLLIVIVVIAAAVILAVGIPLTIRAYRRQVYTGREELVGKTAIVKEDLNPQGQVLVDGELWQALSEAGPVKAGTEVMVTRVEGFKVFVTTKP